MILRQLVPDDFTCAGDLVGDEHAGVAAIVDPRLTDPGRQLEWLREYVALDFDEIDLHRMRQDLDPFIDAFGEHVVPEVAR